VNFIHKGPVRGAQVEAAIKLVESLIAPASATP
jgi:hypothetical protein